MPRAAESIAVISRSLASSTQAGGALVRTRHHVLLRGLLWCARCGAPMHPASTKSRRRLYRYYLCRTARRTGWASCPTSVSAADIEHRVVEQIRRVGADPAVQAATLEAARAHAAGVEVDAEDLRRTLSLWDGVWGALLPKEQARVFSLLIEAIRYDARKQTAALTFRATGIKALSDEVGP